MGPRRSNRRSRIQLLDEHVGTKELHAVAGVDRGPSQADRHALRRVDHVSQTTSFIGFVLFVIGIAAGFATALVGGINLTAPWLLITYGLLLADFLVLRWANAHTANIRAAKNDEGVDLKGVASSPRANATLFVIVGFWLLLITAMILKPFS